MKRLRYYIKWCTDYDFRCYIRKVKRMAHDEDVIPLVRQYWHKRLELLRKDCNKWYIEPCGEPDRRFN